MTKLEWLYSCAADFNEIFQIRYPEKNPRFFVDLHREKIWFAHKNRIYFISKTKLDDNSATSFIDMILNEK